MTKIRFLALSSAVLLILMLIMGYTIVHFIDGTVFSILISGVLLGIAGNVLLVMLGSLWTLLRNKRKRSNITVNIEGTPISISHLTPEEATKLAERFRSLNPHVSVDGQ